LPHFAIALHHAPPNGWSASEFTIAYNLQILESSEPRQSQADGLRGQTPIRENLRRQDARSTTLEGEYVIKVIQ